MLRRSSLRFAFLWLLAVATLLSAHAQQVPAPEEPLRNVQVQVSLTPEGEVCKALIVACGPPLDATRARHPEPLYSVVEHLAPPAERGARKPETSSGYVGNCLDWRKDDYEHVTIFENKSVCGGVQHSATIDWKERGPNCAPLRVSPGTICGKPVGSLEQNEKDVATELTFIAVSMEGTSKAEGDPKLKHALSSYAQQIRHAVSRFKLR